MNEDILQEKLEKYVRGLLPTAELAAFEREIAENPSLQQQVRLHRLAVESTEYLLREKVRQQAKAWLAETPKTPQKKTIRGGRIVLLLLIIIGPLIGIGIYRLLHNTSPAPILPETKTSEPKSEQPVAENSSPSSPAPTSPPIEKNPTKPSKTQSQPVLASLYQLPRNLSEGVLKSAETAPQPDGPLRAGILAFQSGDYDNAIRAFGAIKQENAPLMYALAQEWLAHSWFTKGLKTGDYTQAARLFEARVAQNTQDAAQDQAEWYWTLSLYGNYAQNKKKVNELLQKITADEYHTYREKAADFLKQLAQ